MIYVVLDTVCPSEQEARDALILAEGMPATAPYLGLWRVPGNGIRVHLFSDIAEADLEADGWTREDA